MKKIKKFSDIKEFFMAISFKRMVEFFIGIIVTSILSIFNPINSDFNQAVIYEFNPNIFGLFSVIIGSIFLWIIVYIVFLYFFISSIFEFILWYIGLRSKLFFSAIAPFILCTEGSLIYLDFIRTGSSEIHGFWIGLMAIGFLYFLLGIMIVQRWGGFESK